MIQARVKKWTNLERKLVKRIQKVQKQTLNVKKMVASKQQAEMELKDDIEAVGNAMTKQMEIKLSGKESRSSSPLRKRASAIKQGKSSKKNKASATVSK